VGRSSDRYHDRVARVYDLTYDGDPYWRFYREITWKNLKRYLPRESGARILDAGGGTGYWTVRLARSGFSLSLCDTSNGMLEAARRTVHRAEMESRVEIVKDDICELASFSDGSFDLVIAQGDPLSFCSSAERAVAAIHRVLRPGGRCVASVDNRYGALDHFLDGNDLPGLERFLRTGRTVWLAKRHEERFPVRTFTPVELRKLFTGAGFELDSLVGKTVLPVRKLRHWLEDRQTYVRLMRLETRLHGEEALLGRAAHLEIAACRPRSGNEMAP
jgi:ubiquinone/menaquinone biosynthesis C-methylase UbiE